MIPTLWLISVLSFFIIELPPGDFVTNEIQRMQAQGIYSEEEMLNMRIRYGLDKPLLGRYVKWFGDFIVGDFGFSLSYQRHVRDLLMGRFFLTAMISLLSMLFAWAIAFPIGILSAIRQYSVWDNFWTFIGLLGLATPNFLIALVFMVLSYQWFPELEVGGLFSSQYMYEPWSWGKLVDFLGHLWIPVVVVGTAGTAGTIRITRANLLDELKKPYVEMARSKGMSELRVILKYPLRISLNPFFAGIGGILPALIAGETITAVVLSIPTAGPLVLEALFKQDMHLAGAYIMLVSTFTVVGTLVSDIVLAIVDPRIRYD